MPQVPVEPLLPQNRDECCQQRDQETRTHQIRRGHDLALWASLGGRNGGGLAGNGRLVESEEDGSEKGGRLLVGIGLEIQMDVDDEDGADSREQAGL